MTRLPLPTALLALAALATAPAGAASSAASSASDSASTSVGSASTSIQKSSDSSSKATGVAAGRYRITDVALAADRPGHWRVTLRGADAPDAAREDDELVLVLPRQAAERGRLARGEDIVARMRPYGVEFGRADGSEPFFLVLHDEWHRELPSRPVNL
jgi:poly-gamma-glutamate capsule biosynthesis protein CapA/YwtB (metallophosphatase superfamily)